MIRRYLERHLGPVTVVAGALTAGLAMAVAAGAVALSPNPAHPATATASAPSSGDPYFVCVAYQSQWGICVGPPAI